MDSIIPCQAISFALLNIEVIFKEQNYHKAGWVCGSHHKELGFRRKKQIFVCSFLCDTALLVSIFLFTFSWPAYTVLDPRTKCPLDIKKQNTPSQKRQKTGDKLSSEIRSAFYRIEPKISIESLFTIFWSHNGGKQFRAPTARKNIFQDNIQVL